VRSGDRPIGDTASTDQSSAATEVTGNPEDSDAGRPPAAVHPTAEVAAAPSSAGEDGEAVAAAGEDGESGEGRDAGAGWDADAGGRWDADRRADWDTDPGADWKIDPEADWDADMRSGGNADADAGGPEPGDHGAGPAPGEPGTGAGTAPGQRGPERRRGSLPAWSSARTWLAGAGWAEAARRLRQWADRHPGYVAAGGTGFARITVLPAILVMAWLLVGLPLLLVGAFLPAPTLLIAVPVAVVLAAGLRQVPRTWPRALPGAARAAARALSGPAPAEARAQPGTDPAEARALPGADPAEAPTVTGADPAQAPALPGADPAEAHVLPEASPAEARAPRREPGWPAWWGLAGTIAVAVGFTVWQLLFNSETIIVLRNPGAYLQTGYWIAQHGSLPIPQSLAAFGGSHPGLGFASTGFFASGTSIVPGVMSGLPLLLAGGFWVHGTSAAAAMGPILGGFAVLAFGGLVGRLVGLQWAPAGALVLAFTLPEVYTSRAPFSETAAQVLLFGGLNLVADALALGYAARERGPSPVPRGRAVTGMLDAPGWRRRLSRHGGRGLSRRYTPQQVLMGLGGLALGLCCVVRFDGLLDVLPAIPFIGILLVRRSKTAVPLCIGLAIGAVYGLVDAYVLARPFVDSLRPMPELIGLLAAWLIALTLAAVELLRLPGLRQGARALLTKPPVRWLPEVGGALVVAALIGLAIRPYLQTVRGPVDRAAAYYVASLQRLEHLPVDPGRLYAEDTLYWVIWYVGLPAVLLGGFGLALLVRRCLRALVAWKDPAGTARIWALPLAVICWGSAAVLWQPQTLPDQPWASRRLVPLVLPGLILCSIWASAWLRGRARSRGAGGIAAGLVAACCVGALLVPTIATTFGLGLTHSGSNGALRPSANGLALKRIGQGQAAAVNGLCMALGPSATVVIVDGVVAARFTQVIRGMCGVPVAWITVAPAGNLPAVLTGIERAGRRPVLLGSRPSQLTAYGTPVRALNLFTLQDPHTLTQPPTTPWPAHYVIWMTTPGPFSSRV
jgi:hypothetical protein